jgi:hypothetical protein
MGWGSAVGGSVAEILTLGSRPYPIVMTRMQGIGAFSAAPIAFVGSAHPSTDEVTNETTSWLSNPMVALFDFMVDVLRPLDFEV